MKIYINKITLVLLACITLTACSKDFLDRVPLDDLSVDTFFSSNADLEIYVNGLYGATMPRYDFQAGLAGSNNKGEDIGSDFMINNFSPTGSLFQQGDSGIAPINSGTWNTAYDNIRRTNFFIENSTTNLGSRDNNSDHFIGEGYFFRAWHYFNLLNNFGGVPIIDKALGTGDEELFKERNSRSEVAKFILKDLDSAIVNLSWKGTGPAVAGRINKDAALTMKARVALFEGTWQYYHAQNATPHSEPNSDGTTFLQMVEPTVQQLIAKNGSSIYTNGGIFNEPYNQLFAITNGESTPGVFWYRVYDTEIITTNSHNFYNNITDSGPGFTDRLVNLYLDADGIPQSLSARPLTTLNEKGQNLEPRFKQTIWTPDRGPMNLLPGRTSQGDSPFRYPNIKPTAGNSTSTGYRQWKGAVLGDVTRYRAGTADDIFIRYAEALLAMAEAKAILGTITQSDIDVTVNVLRGRVGAPAMNLNAINSWAISYSATEGFDPSGTNIVNEIRRERSIEFVNEGFRINDLKRWAIFESAINGYRPKGAHLQEFLDYFNDPAQLIADGLTGSATPFQITADVDVKADPNGLINPFFKIPEFIEGGQGYFVDPRSYLNAIPSSQIDLYGENGTTLTQNPGWN
ncbi:RagB/SusD family nutrient uptake outer membrane protein [Sabulilitoribacter arenilitoris]|uniref:RagB/SusD family nutrient uptake outer membrane protein n=1 Tax=Wocania arenilitoris TaxID=2044858 RepID=A0AAE3EPC0_9FLAO|nr:RagB/SusD family nutrient uptake outer membrane protein [Wocania arenilitoris]MCF7567769.1 RagB/SusD family nutrient uptake outer membrane protein [Wocania arenilitoris]